MLADARSVAYSPIWLTARNFATLYAICSSRYQFLLPEVTTRMRNVHTLYAFPSLTPALELLLQSMFIEIKISKLDRI